MDGRLNPVLRLRVRLSALGSLLGGKGPIALPMMERPVLRRTFSGVQRMETLQVGEGEHVDYVRMRLHFASEHQDVFVKYRLADDFNPRRYQRFLNEAHYLREFAPLVNIPHAALLDAAHDPVTRKAHLVLEDLSARCVGWPDLPESERFGRLEQVMGLIADFHAQWMLHPRLQNHPSFPWDQALPALIEKHLGKVRNHLEGSRLPEEVLRTLHLLLEEGRLAAVLSQARQVTLCHGDLHFGQVLLDRLNPDRLYLIDYEHTWVAPLGFDLAHFLVVRFNWFERTRLEKPLLEAYLQGLQRHGITLTLSELLVGYRAGILHNFLAMWSRYHQEEDPMFRELLLRLHLALQEHQVLQVQQPVE